MTMTDDSLKEPSLSYALQQVAEFHRAIGANVRNQPALLTGNRQAAGQIAAALRQVQRRGWILSKGGDELLARLTMAIEELAEWAEAQAAGDLLAAADAWGDRLYLLLGDAVASGLPAQAIFDEIHRSNLTKTQRHAGHDGKAVKDACFQLPRLATILSMHRTEQ
jgi:predicted HAD superfamily Cof-like phosphohydrolase